ncbi:MAG: S41 family peptidase [Fibrobacterota bacterium]
MKKQIRTILPTTLILLSAFRCFGPGLNGNGTSSEYQFAWRFLDIYFIFRDSLPEDPYRFESPVQLYESVDEPYTVYRTSEEAEEMLQGLSTTTGGMGIRIDSVSSGYVIEQVFPNTPAREAGLQKGDTIVSVEGRSVDNVSQQQMSALLRGEVGEEKDLGIRRGGSQMEITVTIDTFMAPSVFTDSLGGDIAYIYISSFFSRTAVPGGTAEEFRAALQTTRWANTLIVDVRDNPGGEVSQAVGVISQFLEPNTPIVQSIERVLVSGTDSGTTVDTTWETLEGYSDLSDREILILTNSNTASAAEILVTSLNTHRPDITTVGFTTFGKARGQAVSLTPDSGLAVVTYALLNPINGEPYDMRGIRPDVAVGAGEDPLQRALELAREQLAKISSMERESVCRKTALLRQMYALKKRGALALIFPPPGEMKESGSGE